MRNHLSKLTMSLFLVTFVLLIATPVQAAVESRDLNFTGFTGVSVGWGMQLKIAQAQAYSVRVQGEPGDLNQMKVEKSGDTLKFSMERGFSFRHRGRISIDITMPKLTSLDVSGGADANIVMDTGGASFDAGLSGGAELHGELKCGDLKVSMSGGAEAELAGAANNLELEGSGGAEAHFQQLNVQNVRLDMSGGSEAQIYADGVISGEMSGGSEVRYSGKGSIGNTDFSGGSKIRKGV